MGLTTHREAKAARVSPSSNEESRRCVWSFAKAAHQGWGYRSGESLQLGLHVPYLLTQFTVASATPASTARAAVWTSVGPLLPLRYRVDLSDRLTSMTVTPRPVRNRASPAQ